MRAAVAFSGGLDSTAAAILLKRRGFDVLAVHMLLPGEMNPGATQAIAEAIDVEYATLDVTAAFENLVIEPFIKGYLEGLTPNPCVTCNRAVKFGILFDEAKKRRFDVLATGHYGRVTGGDGTPYRILKGVDSKKDQSYVLWTLSQETLKRVLLPVGELTRDKVEKLVRETGVRDIVQPESQDICFLSGHSYYELLENRAPETIHPGPIVDSEGRVLGEHKGLAFYTVGQRHGLGLGGHMALYVIELRPTDNTLVVGGIEDRNNREFAIHKVNFISGDFPTGTFSCEVATRYQGKPLPAEVEVYPDKAGKVRYIEPGPPAAPGQSAVFYRGGELLGGGFISQTIISYH
jgi:tRNA-specific 2-thiouridylase